MHNLWFVLLCDFRSGWNILFLFSIFVLTETKSNKVLMKIKCFNVHTINWSYNIKVLREWKSASVIMYPPLSCHTAWLIQMHQCWGISTINASLQKDLNTLCRSFLLYRGNKWADIITHSSKLHFQRTSYHRDCCTPKISFSFFLCRWDY